MELITDRLRLREFDEVDYDFFYSLETNEDCLKYEAEEPLSDKSIQEKFKFTFEDMKKDPRERYRLLITKLDTNELVGKIVMWKIDDTIREWEIGWEIHPKHWGQGYAPEAAKALLMFAFQDLKVHRVQALCNEANTNSEKVMIKIGMQKEGVLRGVRYLNGKWYGSVIYSVLEGELDF